jgi:hypothetical protein
MPADSLFGAQPDGIKPERTIASCRHSGGFYSVLVQSRHTDFIPSS